MAMTKKTRLNLQTKLEELLGSKHVYYQPPENLKMEYPAIRYSKDDIFDDRADNLRYRNFDVYTVVIIDKKPDNPVIQKILDMDYASFDRHYVSDNLNHDIIKIYF